MEITAELVKTSTEARCGFMTFEAAHRSVSSLDPAMVLLDPIIQILVSHLQNITDDVIFLANS
jgi:hypothetical protein